MDGWSWHDCRRTAATAMARLGCARETVEAALNHITARGGLVGIYQQYDFEIEGAPALLCWQAHVEALVEDLTKVLPSRREKPIATAIEGSKPSLSDEGLVRLCLRLSFMDHARTLGCVSHDQPGAG